MRYFILLFSVFFIVGCFEGSDDTEVYELPFDVSESGEFKKFKRPYNSHKDIVKEIGDIDTSWVSSGRIAAKRGREHMVPNKKHNQFALYEGETFVLDLAYVAINFQTHKKFHVQVLGDFEPLSFHLEKVKGSEDFPSMSVISTFNDFQKMHGFSLENDVIEKFTIVIPSESFERTGAYDIRILVTPDIEPREDLRQIRIPELGFSVTLYYGGSDFLTRPVMVPIAEYAPFTHQEAESMARYNSVLLPSLDFFNDVEKYNNKLAGVISVSEATEVVALHHANVFSEGKQDVYAGFIVNGKVERESLQLTTVDHIPDGAIPANTTVAVTRHEVKVDDQVNVVFVSFERPFVDQALASNEFEGLIELSNILFLKNEERN